MKLTKGQLKLGETHGEEGKARILFLKTTHEGYDDSIFAVLPDSLERDGCVMGYAHVGQHTACCEEYIYEHELATEDEYADLLAEMKSIYESHDRDYLEIVVLNPDFLK